MPNSKTSVHDGLTKAFYGHFQDDLKFYFIDSLKQSKFDGCRPISQMQVIIKLIAKQKTKKTNKKKKSLAEKLKHVALELISSNQTTYVKNQCISESGRLIPDVIKICDILDIPSYNRY